MNEIIAHNTKHIIEIIIVSCQWNYNGGKNIKSTLVSVNT